MATTRGLAETPYLGSILLESFSEPVQFATSRPTPQSATTRPTTARPWRAGKPAARVSAEFVPMHPDHSVSALSCPRAGLGSFGRDRRTSPEITRSLTRNSILRLPRGCGSRAEMRRTLHYGKGRVTDGRACQICRRYVGVGHDAAIMSATPTPATGGRQAMPARWRRCRSPPAAAQGERDRPSRRRREGKSRWRR